MDRLSITRRDLIRGSAAAGLAASSGLLMPQQGRGQQQDGASPLEIGSRRELFIDDLLVDQLSGKAQRRLHHPVPREVVLVHDAPWEGSGSGFHSIFQDGNRYRMYYKAWHLHATEGRLDSNRHPLYCCYAESPDGIAWEKPNLGLHAFDGSKENNIVLATGRIGALNVDPGHPAVFKDDNPNASADARYKAIVRSAKPVGVIPFKSPDGIHFSPMTERPLLVGQGAFDSQNLAFWDAGIGKYRAYWRIFTDGRRAIRTATSDNLVDWGPHADLTYADSPPEQLYINQVKPYYRAPHVLIGFPARYIDRGWSDSMRDLPELEHRQLRASSVKRYGTAITESLLMASRDGVHFQRWNEAFLRPGVERPGVWNYGHQFIGWHVVETQSALEGGPPELSLYASENYWTGESNTLRRYTLRLDGFVSVSAPAAGGELLTPPITFSGTKLNVNFASSAAGSLRVEIQSADGKPIEGMALADCPDHFGDSIERTIRFKDGIDVSALAGRPVRLRVSLRDADLYSFQFV